MTGIETIVGILAGVISTLAGLVVWLVKGNHKVMEKLMDVIRDNAVAFTGCSKALERNTETQEQMMKVIQDYLLPPKK